MCKKKEVSFTIEFDTYIGIFLKFEFENDPKHYMEIETVIEKFRRNWEAL